VAASTTLSPEQRKERARKAGKAAHSLDAILDRIVARAPELTAEQRAKLGAIVTPGEAA
jgi:hypothetical protein